MWMHGCGEVAAPWAVRARAFACAFRSEKSPPMVGLAQESLQTWRNWQRNEFRCSFGGCIGNETSFGAVCALSIQANGGFACIFRCKNNEMTCLAPLFWRSGRLEQGDLSLNRLKSLHRNSFGCQAGRDYCTETCLAAIRATRQELIGRSERPCGCYDPPIHAACELFVAMLPRSRRRRH